MCIFSTIHAWPARVDRTIRANHQPLSVTIWGEAGFGSAAIPWRSRGDHTNIITAKRLSGAHRSIIRFTAEQSWANFSPVQSRFSTDDIHMFIHSSGSGVLIVILDIPDTGIRPPSRVAGITLMGRL